MAVCNRILKSLRSYKGIIIACVILFSFSFLYCNILFYTVLIVHQLTLRLRIRGLPKTPLPNSPDNLNLKVVGNESHKETRPDNKERNFEKWIIDVKNMVAPNPAQVLIVTYMRSGSSFLGELLNQNRHAFYWYEPLDAVYQSLYGLKSGHAHPIDIMVSPDGSQRATPTHEADATKNAVRNILNCEFAKLPTELLVTPFLKYFYSFQKSTHSYYRCLKKSIPHFHRRTCQSIISKVCPEEFGKEIEQQNVCFSLLNPKNQVDDEGYYKLPENFTQNTDISQAVDKIMNVLIEEHDFSLESWKSVISKKETMKDIKKVWKHFDGIYARINLYKKCQNHFRDVALSCVDVLKNRCKEAQIRSLKTIRMKLSTAADILKDMPSIKIIYNVRSPLAMAFSRKRANWSTSMSTFSERNIMQEARTACDSIRDDMEIFSLLSEQNQEAIKLNSYESFAKSPSVVAKALYQFIDKSVPVYVENWLKKNSKNSAEISTQWQQNVTIQDFVVYKDMCKLDGLKFEELSEWLEAK